MRHLHRVTAAPAITFDDLPQERQQVFILRLVIALAALFKGSSPF